MKKEIGKIILFIFGWKVSYPTQFRFPKMVMIAAPYTSSWDVLFTFAAYWSEGINPKFLVSNKWVTGVRGLIFRPLGAIEANRQHNESAVDISVKLFNNSSNLALIVTPEGSKNKVDRWKTGFFHIATKADVPVSLGFIDYENKVVGIGGFLNMSGNFEKDMNYIEKFYKTTKPKNPERFNPKLY